MLVAAAFARPARWLILPALSLALSAGFVTAAGIDLDGGIGDREYRPTAATDIRDSYKLGVGELVVDLRQADLPAGRPPDRDRRRRRPRGCCSSPRTCA